MNSSSSHASALNPVAARFILGSARAASSEAFTVFPGLPQEIQDQIWEAALPGPRLVTIVERPGWAGLTMQNPTIHQLRSSIRALCQPLVLLQVSFKSRDVVLRHYKPTFSQILSSPVFFNFAVDILHFSSFHPLSVFDEVATATHSHAVESRLVQKVAIPHVHATTTPHNSLQCVMDLITTWHNLKEAFLVSHAFNGPINGFSAECFAGLLSLHRGVVIRGMTEKEQREWEAPAVIFLREEDLNAMFG